MLTYQEAEMSSRNGMILGCVFCQTSFLHSDCIPQLPTVPGVEAWNVLGELTGPGCSTSPNQLLLSSCNVML